MARRRSSANIHTFPTIPRDKNGKVMLKRFRKCPCGERFQQTHKLQIYCPKCRQKRKSAEEKRMDNPDNKDMENS